MMDFAGSAGAATPFDLIPNGQLAFAILVVRGVKSSASGGQYLDCELTIDDNQPFARKKLWTMIGDPQHAGNSEKYRAMGMIAITRILECGRGAGPANLAGYKIGAYTDLSGARVAIKIGVEKGENGHADKNKVAEFLTPNPASQSGHKLYQQLMAGVFNTAAPAPATGAQSGFGGFGGGATARPATGGFGTPTPTPPATGGFGAAGGAPAAASGFPQAGATPQTDAAPATAGSTTSGFASTANATGPSPSDPTTAPSWLAQAGAQ